MLCIRAAGAVERVVSLNLCTDQLLVLLAPEKIAALTTLARDPGLSFVAAEAKAYPVIRPSAEAVLRLNPDLVLAAPYGAQTTLTLLAQQGVRVMQVDLPTDFPGIRAQIRTLAGTLDATGRGEALIEAMDAMLSALPRPERRLTALAWQARGYVSGPGTLVDAIMAAAGLVNGATTRRAGVEALARRPPDLLVVPEAPAYPSLATEILAAPAAAPLRRFALPMAETICAGPFSAMAARRLTR